MFKHILSPQDHPSSSPADYHLIKAATLLETSVQQSPLLSICQFMRYAACRTFFGCFEWTIHSTTDPSPRCQAQSQAYRCLCQRRFGITLFISPSFSSPHKRSKSSMVPLCKSKPSMTPSHNRKTVDNLECFNDFMSLTICLRLPLFLVKNIPNFFSRNSSAHNLLFLFMARQTSTAGRLEISDNSIFSSTNSLSCWSYKLLHGTIDWILKLY